MEQRYIVTRSKEKAYHWICTDTVEQVECLWENGNFNNTKKFTFLDEEHTFNGLSPQEQRQKLVFITAQMGDFLRKYHFKKFFFMQEKNEWQVLFAEKIRYEREKLGISVEDLAEKANVTPSFLECVENLKLTAGLSVYAKIFDALGLRVEFVKK